eukprot:4443304-Amphidinium_carterae.1
MASDIHSKHSSKCGACTKKCPLNSLTTQVTLRQCHNTCALQKNSAKLRRSSDSKLPNIP